MPAILIGKGTSNHCRQVFVHRDLHLAAALYHRNDSGRVSGRGKIWLFETSGSEGWSHPSGLQRPLWVAQSQAQFGQLLWGE
jgi:hypothetical protein